ncbi:thioredoxin-like protein [Xylaria palmicola]|nr:thioredoxin-like protein [Xylaria palmicola]
MSFRAATRIALRRPACPAARPAARPAAALNHRLPALRPFHTTLPNMTVHNIESKAAFEEAVKKNPVVIVDAFAVWCGPCKAIAPLIVKMSDDEKFKDVFFAKIDVDELPELSQELGITAMPTFVAFKDGKLSDKVVGANPKAVTDLVAKQL